MRITPYGTIKVPTGDEWDQMNGVDLQEFIKTLSDKDLEILGVFRLPGSALDDHLAATRKIHLQEFIKTLSDKDLEILGVFRLPGSALDDHLAATRKIKARGWGN